MTKRKNLVDKFSSFICFTGGNNQTQLSWKVDTRLENNMKSKVEADPEARESFWAQYFLKILLIQGNEENQDVLNVNPGCSFSTAKKHFSAYLQESCFIAAKEMHNEFTYIKHKYSLEEYFQIANIAASSPAKFFKSFNFERNQINIEAYAITGLKRFIRNQIYQQDLEARRTKFSKYGLLKDLTVRELNEALLEQNVQSEQIIFYRLAWQCFYEISEIKHKRNPTNREQHPSTNEFTIIANYYNQRCKQLNLFYVRATSTSIQEMLLACINAAKKFRHKQYLYFEEDYYGISDNRPSTLDVLIQEEEYQQLQKIIDNLFQDMPQLCQIIFKLWYGLNLTQTEIANILKYKYPELQKQYQVARKVKRYNREVLKKFIIKWYQTNPDIHLKNELDVEKIKPSVDDCFKLYCQKLIFYILEETIKKISEEEKKYILNYKKDINRIVVQRENNDSEESNEENEKFNKFNSSIHKLSELFKYNIEVSICLEQNSLSAVDNKISEVVNKWIYAK